MPQNRQMSKRVSVDLEQVLEELGAIGRYQVYTILLVLLPVMLTAVYNSQYVFAVADVDYRCLVPECESPPAQYEAGTWAAWALVPGERCQRRRPIANAGGAASCAQDAFATETVPCTAWVYHNMDTIVGEFDLACQDWKRTLVGTVHSVGLFFALLITGLFSDSYGRRLAFILTASSRAVTGLARYFSPNYATYLALEFADSAACSGTYSTGFILALEMVGTKRRVIAGNMMSSGFACGQMLLALVAWAIPNWKTLTLVLYLPSAVFITYLLCLEESVRWLLQQGNRAEAARIIFKAARINNKKLRPEVIRHLTTEPQRKEPDLHDPKMSIQLEHEMIAGPPPPLWRQVTRSRVLMPRLFICGFWWMTTTFTYYGLSINSVALAGNKYLNFVLTSLVEIPGYALSVLSLDRCGRKPSIMCAFFMCSLALIVLPFVPKELPGLVLACSLVGKLVVSWAFGSLYVYTAELYPTVARISLLNLCSMVGRIGQIFAPLTPLMMLVWEPLPYLAFGAMSATSGLLMMLTPETLRMKLPDTVAEAENMAIAMRHRHRHPVDIITD